MTELYLERPKLGKKEALLTGQLGTQEYRTKESHTNSAHFRCNVVQREDHLQDKSDLSPGFIIKRYMKKNLPFLFEYYI